jgi:hypothetical protein
MRKIQALTTIAALTLAAGLSPAHAGADSSAPEVQPSLNMSKADKDADGRISRAEAASSDPKLAKKFDVVDADRDGTLSPAEFAQYEGQGAAPDSPSQTDDTTRGRVRPAPGR